MFSSAKNICLTLLNVFTIGVGLVIFGAGTYGSVMDMIAVYSGPDVGSAFGCR